MAVVAMSESVTPPDSESVADLPPRLNLGCGEDYREHYWNIDVSDSVSPDQLVDLEDTPWPLPTDHFRYVIAEHVIEHLANPVDVMQEVARVTQPGGHVEIAVPTGVNARTDPTHKHQWTFNTPEYFDANGPYWWEAGCNLRLKDRELSLHTHGPMRYLAPFVQLWCRYDPMSAADLPATSGELRVVYEVIP